MDILELALASGLYVTLDGRIGMQEYKSVHGSLPALLRFADAVLGTASSVTKRSGIIETDSRTSLADTQAHEVLQAS